MANLNFPQIYSRRKKIQPWTGNKKVQSVQIGDTLIPGRCVVIWSFKVYGKDGIQLPTWAVMQTAHVGSLQHPWLSLSSEDMQHSHTPGLKVLHSPRSEQQVQSACAICQESTLKHPQVGCLCLRSACTLNEASTVPLGGTCTFARLWKPLLTQFLSSLPPETAPRGFKDSKQ